MKKNRQKYGKEFIAEAVQLYLHSDKTQRQIANELGCPPNSLSRWVALHHKEQEAQKHPNESSDDRIRRLEKELSIVKQERDILKKSLGIVSKL